MILGASPTATTGASDRHSSSSAPAAANCPSSLGPPSVSSRVCPRSGQQPGHPGRIDALPLPGEQHLRARGTGLGHPVGRCARAGQHQGGDQRLGEQRQGEVQPEAGGHHGDGGGRPLPGGGPAGGERLPGPGRPVALLPYGLRADHHRVREPAQHPEDPHVGIAGERLRAALVMGRAVQRRTPCSPAASRCAPSAPDRPPPGTHRRRPARRASTRGPWGRAPPPRCSRRQGPVRRGRREGTGVAWRQCDMPRSRDRRPPHTR